MSKRKGYALRERIDTWLRKHRRTEAPKQSTLSPENNLDGGNVYEYTDADAPYTAEEIECHFWELIVNEED